MVGINLVFSYRKNNSILNSQKFLETQKSMLHLNTYISKILFNDSKLIVGTTAYKEYPLEVIEYESFVIIIEGIIYNLNKQQIYDSIHEIIFSIKNVDILKRKIKRFQSKADGEYVIILYNNLDNTFCIFNDSLGRLPIYWHMNEDLIIISREIKFFYPYINKLRFKKISLAEYLLFGFVLGERTLIEGINRVMPRSFILHDKIFVMNNETEYPCFRAKVQKTNIKMNYIYDFKNIFLKALESKISKLTTKKQLISLSGGLDSRATLAGLIKLGISPYGITHTLSSVNKKEFEYSKKLAEKFNIPLNHIKSRVNDINLKTYRKLVKLKDCTQPIDFVNQLDLIEQIFEKEGNNIVLYTGLYGGEITRYLNITSGLSSDKDLVKFLMSTPDAYRHPIKNICKILNINKSEISEHIMKHLSSYPEKDVYSKYLHFKFEKDYKWAGEGEDRYRLFFWIITPYFSKELFDFLFSIDEREKDTKFFRDFLFLLDQRTCSVKYFNNNLDLNNSFMLKLNRMAEKSVRNVLVRKIVSFLIKIPKIVKTEHSEMKDILKLKEISTEMLLKIKAKNMNMSFDYIKKLIKKEKNKFVITRILALLIYIDILEEFIS